MKNLTIFQFFHWYYKPEDKLWLHAGREASHLKNLGVTHVWLPPAYKSSYGLENPGYAAYDLYDLGEFDQKGTIPTRYGSKDEYLTCIRTLHDQGLQVFADIVLNHKFGADEKEKIPVQKVNAENRNETVEEPHEAERWTKFNFPGRKGNYSDYVWDWHSFTGLSDNGKDIYRILNEYGKNGWEEMLENENGNYDYLMGNDIEFRNPSVREELKKWGTWYIETTGVNCFRLDALKHIHYDFFNDWIDHLKNYFEKDFWFIGEYWRNDANMLIKYIEATGGRMQLFDVPLHYNFEQASKKKKEYDLRNIFQDSLLSKKPEFAITFVDNHDTQPLQGLQSPVDYWFQPLAYALILLRQQGTPCIFYPHIYGAKYWDRIETGDEYAELSSVYRLECMLKVRKNFAYGFQHDYFDHPNTIGWTREGTDDNLLSGCAVLLTNAGEEKKRMEIGKRNAGKQFVDVCGNRQEKIVIDNEGWGEFYVNNEAVSVWIDEAGLSLLDQ